MNVDDDDECMNAAAAHMLRLLGPSQHRACTGYYVINIHKLHPLPKKKIGLGSADFLHSGTPLIAHYHFLVN